MKNTKDTQQPEATETTKEGVHCSALLGDGISNLVTLKEWEKSLGVSAVTLWRWRCAGMFSTVNIKGRQYVTKDEIRAFEQRAINGDYAEEHHCGSNPKNGGKSPNAEVCQPEGGKKL